MNPADLTPVQDRSGRWYKREDAFCHRSGVNGAKWRQCLWLLRRAREAGYRRVVTGASVLSPQHAMTAVACRELGLPCTIVVGGTTPAKAVRHRSIKVAVAAGARIDTARVGYNPAIQRKVTDLAAETDAFILRYGVTTGPDAEPEEVYAFHAVGAPQVNNLPRLRTLIVPFGSGNSGASILLGLAERPPAVDHVVLVGIGPNRLDWLADRLDTIGKGRGEWLPELPFTHYDLHGSGQVTYGERVPWTSDGIRLHPTYEGKVARWAEQNCEAVPGWAERDGTACMWIIGGELQ